jgi:hypothetical protein
MKKFVVILFAALAAVSSASAATLTVNGAVASFVDVAASGATLSVDLFGDGTVGTGSSNVGTLTIKSNEAAYTISMYSLNGGLLLNASTIPYTVTLSSPGVGTVGANAFSSGPLASTFMGVANAKTMTVTAGKTPKAGTTASVTVAVPVQDALYTPGTYVDTLTITIAKT